MVRCVAFALLCWARGLVLSYCGVLCVGGWVGGWVALRAVQGAQAEVAKGQEKVRCECAAFALFCWARGWVLSVCFVCASRVSSREQTLGAPKAVVQPYSCCANSQAGPMRCASAHCITEDTVSGSCVRTEEEFSRVSAALPPALLLLLVMQIISLGFAV